MTYPEQLAFKCSLPPENGNQNSPPQMGETIMNLENDWNVYRTRFVVRARQLTDSLIFTDALGREQSGQPGDYLVEIFDGLLSITPRKFFEDIYVPLEPKSGSNRELPPVQTHVGRAPLRAGRNPECADPPHQHRRRSLVDSRGSPLRRPSDLMHAPARQALIA